MPSSFGTKKIVWGKKGGKIRQLAPVLGGKRRAVDRLSELEQKIRAGAISGYSVGELNQIRQNIGMNRLNTDLRISQKAKRKRPFRIPY